MKDEVPEVGHKLDQFFVPHSDHKAHWRCRVAGSHHQEVPSLYPQLRHVVCRLIDRFHHLPPR